MSHEEAQPVHDNAPDMLERFLVGEEYIADHPEIVRRNRRAMELADRFNRVWASDPEAGESILRELLGGIGENTTVRAPIQIDYGTNLTIGSRTFINFGLTALDVVPITIGDDVQMGPNIQLLAPRHPLDSERRIAGWESGEPITIEDGCWLGGGVIVCPGVTIGRRSVIGAGAVVTRDIPPFSLAVGNPARVIRALR
ncbi:sugar O-acetyltransferase [Pseudoclavibacter albus]|uniref:sugar O-acetyltransferase n=1 Tax=Pseudoclavibacter albus TaxID=272241 RepID=UPI0008241CB7|nr:sugar O-acetyltransferase [Pseudoclavibacter alba]